MNQFWDWMEERHRIHVKRFVNNEDPPWTNDQILRDYHFCNVYRELDRVTQYYRDHIAGRGDPEDVFLNTALFRIFNQTETWDLIGNQSIDDFDPDEIVETINHEREKDLVAFNSAYMITGSAYPHYTDKVKKYVRGMAFEEIIPRIDEFCRWDLDPDDLTDRWTEIPGISDFMAYEIYCDLTHNRWFPHTKNDYVNPGPGARRGLRWIEGIEETNYSTMTELKTELDDGPKRETIEMIRSIEDQQTERLSSDFYQMPDAHRLNLRDIEHSLCEFDKYRRSRWSDERGLRMPMDRFDSRDQGSLDDF